MRISRKSVDMLEKRTSLIREIWEDNEGEYVGLAYRISEGDFHRRVYRRGDWKSIGELILYAEEHGFDIYANVNCFSEKRATKATAVRGRWLYADLDKVSKVDELGLKPTVLIQSSPGKYVGLWRLDDRKSYAMKGEEIDHLNRALTYMMAQDNNGWEAPKVLRLLPGARNFKYDSEPVVKVVWDDGPEYAFAEVEEFARSELIKLKKKRLSIVGGEGDVSVWRNKLPAKMLREIATGDEGRQSRSEQAYKFIKTMVEHRVPPEAALQIILPWSSATEYRTEEKLEYEIEKIYQEEGYEPEQRTQKKKVVARGDSAAAAERRIKPIQVNLADRRNIEWVWYPYLARGELHTISGDPGVGKSFVMLAIAQAFAEGGRLPSIDGGMTTPMPQGNVLVCSLEDDYETVLVGRLEDMGIDDEDAKNIHIVNTPFAIVDDDYWTELEEECDRLRPKLVVFDTLTKFYGSGDMSKANLVAPVMARLVKLARRFNCIVMVVTHLNKSAKEKGIYRVADSREIIASSRVALMVHKMPDDPDNRRVITVGKSNYGHDDIKSLMYSITPLGDLTRPIPQGGTKTFRHRSKLEFEGFEKISMEEIFNTKITGVKNGESQLDKCMRFLDRELDQGWVNYSELTGKLEEEGLTISRLRVASLKMEIQKVRIKRGTYWAKKGVKKELLKHSILTEHK